MPELSPSSVDDVVTDRLRLVDQRYTSGRRRLVGALMDAPRPVTIPELIDGQPGLRQSSAYRNLHVLEQDRRVVESIRPEEIPQTLKDELHIRVPDLASIAYRRWLATVDMQGVLEP